jgi:hypothetical protein
VPLWTAPAFDRCLLLALIYPIMAIFLIWAVQATLARLSPLWVYCPEVQAG